MDPAHFSSSRGMSVPSNSPHSPVKLMSAPKETYSVTCVSVLFGDTRSVHSQHKQRHTVVQAEIGDQCILVQFYCRKSEGLRIIK